MIAVAPYVLLIPYALFLLGYAFFAIVTIYALGKYGARNAVGLTTSFFFVCGTMLILFVTWKSLAEVDWTTPIPLASVPAQAF